MFQSINFIQKEKERLLKGKPQWHIRGNRIVDICSHPDPLRLNSLWWRCILIVNIKPLLCILQPLLTSSKLSTWREWCFPLDWRDVPWANYLCFHRRQQKERLCVCATEGGNLGHEKRRPLFFALRGRIYSVATILSSRQTGLRDVFVCLCVGGTGGGAWNKNYRQLW